MNKIMRMAPVLMMAMFLAVPGKAAFAASLTVSVQQGSGATQTVTCTLLQHGCVLPFVLNAGQPTQQSVNINVVYYSGGLALNFQTPSGYFYTGNTVGNMTMYNSIWNRRLQGSTPATYQVALFQPFASNLGMPGNPNANYSSFANLTITATPSP